MALSPGLQLRQTQRLALTPGLHQSLSILQMSAGELSDYIATELADNPILTATFPQSSSSTDIYQYATDTVAQPISLGMFLDNQINQMSGDPAVKSIAIYLGRNLDDSGFLADPIQVIADTLSADPTIVVRALGLLQGCEPVGIGAVDLRDCLDIQMRALDVERHVRTAILDHLELIAAKNTNALARKSGLKASQIADLPKLISKLNPKPAAAFTDLQIQPIYPDVLVEPDTTGFSVSLSQSLAPSLSINTDLIAQIKNADPLACGYVAQQNSRALQLIRAVDRRSKTLLRLTKAVVTLQHRFFQEGPERLIPMSLANLTEKLQLHPSTISRAMAGKSLSCSMGVFPLKFFLARPVPKLDGKKPLSTFVVQQKIRRLIEDELPGKPLSDEAIVTYLRDNGVDIARRTVAKYRQCLKIPSSSSRRRSKAHL